MADHERVAQAIKRRLLDLARQRAEAAAIEAHVSDGKAREERWLMGEAGRLRPLAVTDEAAARAYLRAVEELGRVRAQS